MEFEIAIDSAERTAVEYDRLAAADQHRIIFAKRDLTAARVKQ